MHFFFHCPPLQNTKSTTPSPSALKRSKLTEVFSRVVRTPFFSTLLFLTLYILVFLNSVVQKIQCFFSKPQFYMKKHFHILICSNNCIPLQSVESCGNILYHGFLLFFCFVLRDLFRRSGIALQDGNRILNKLYTIKIGKISRMLWGFFENILSLVPSEHQERPYKSL